jgi:hypothetical protein
MDLRIDGLRFPIVLIFELYSSLPIQLGLSFSRYVRWGRQEHRLRMERPYLSISQAHGHVLKRYRTLSCKSSILLWIPVQVLLLCSLEYFICRILNISNLLSYVWGRVGRTYLGISPNFEPAVT